MFISEDAAEEDYYKLIDRPTVALSWEASLYSLEFYSGFMTFNFDRDNLDLCLGFRLLKTSKSAAS